MLHAMVSISTVVVTILDLLQHQITEMSDLLITLASLSGTSAL